MMEPNEKVREAIFEIIKNQLEANNPAETKITYHRLVRLGYNEFETNQLIAQCVAVEIFDVLKHNKPFNESRYIKNLSKLPDEPFE